MVYQMHLKLLSAKILDQLPHSAHVMVLNIEFTPAWQEDGHMPSDGDMGRNFAETIIHNISRKIIADLLKDNRINGFADICSYGVEVHETDRFIEFMPVYIMELRIVFVPEEDAHLSLANQLLGNVGWNATKAAIASPGKYFYDTTLNKQ